MSEPFDLTDDSPVYVISVAAQISGLHAQTLRQYDRLGPRVPWAYPWRRAALLVAASPTSARCSGCPTRE